MEFAKVLRHGGLQAVGLPEDHRFDSAEARIRRHGAAVILESVSQDWAWLVPLVRPVDADFESAAVARPEAQ